MKLKKFSSVLLILIILTLTLGGCFGFIGGSDRCKVNFYVDGELYTSTEVSVGNTVSMPRDPEKTNQIFIGWYREGLIPTRFDFSDRLIGDVDLHAHFTLDAEAVTDMVFSSSMHSLVTVYNKNYNTTMGGFVETESNTAQGSGVIVDISNGWCYVLTNCHVVEPMSRFSNQRITVEDVWGEVYDAQIYKGVKKTESAISADYDLALVCFRYTPDLDKELLEIRYAASDPQIGEPVISLGAPAGQKNSLTCGEVLNYRRIETSDGEETSELDFEVILHGAAINHGSSGGPLLNSEGQLVGLNYAGFESGSYGCAIPISKIIEFMNRYVY